MERSLMATGIGGQGIQLAAQVIARAAIADGRQVMMFGNYGGMMRGGNTDATLVIGEGPIDTPPVIAECWLGVAMHHEHLAPLVAKLTPTSVLFVNSSVVDAAVATAASVVPVAATDLAVEVAALVSASMVMVGAVAGATGLLSRRGLEAGLAEALPSYRTAHHEINTTALDAGFATGEALRADQSVPCAWEMG